MNLLNHVVLNQLANRGTAEAYQQLRRVQAALPKEDLRFILRSTAEVVRRNAWQPASLATIVALGTGSSQSADQGTDIHSADLGSASIRKPSTRKTGRKSARFQDSDRELREIAQIKPQAHSEVFDSLQGRVKVPSAYPFKSAVTTFLSTVKIAESIG
jgi:hypothetical protein